MIRLSLDHAGRQQDLDLAEEPVTVGRQLGNVVTLKDDNVSRFHCVLELRHGAPAVRDLGSRNGTTVNGRRIDKPCPLKGGDVVGVGSARFTVTSPTANDPAPKPKKARDGADVTFVTESGDTPDKMAVAASAEDIARLAGQLPSRNVKPSDIVLLNARGKKALDRGEADGGAPAESVTLLRLILLICFRTGASDVHVESRTEGYVVRVRIDGTMVDIAKLPTPTGVKLASLVKVLADIDIGRSNVIQEGSFAARVPDRRVDYRVSFTPALYGQKLVVRVLDAANAPQYLWDLGLADDHFALLDRVVRRNEGMVLVCGPTGSGKSSSLYAMLRSVDPVERNVVTIEDPVEIRLDNVNQIPVNDDAGNSFAALLRSVLRQDPDVILVGEIRDADTARAAVQAAVTGHLVFSTLHAKDTLTALFRLVDLGVETFQAASALQTVVSQRLVRRLCPNCRRPRPASDADRALAGRPLTILYDAVGCKTCLNTGFARRRAVYEVLHLSERVKDALLAKADPGELYTILRETGFRKLRESALDLAEQGQTTLDEADRATGA